MPNAHFTVELEDDVSPGAKRAMSSLERLRGKFDSFRGGALGKAGAAFAAFGAAVATAVAVAGAAIAGFAALAAAKFTGAAIDAAMFGERSQKAFQILAKPGEDAARTFDTVRGLAAQLGLDVRDTLEAAQRFRAFGFDQGTTEDLIKMGADMKVLGASTDQVGRAFLALSQIKAAGRLQGDELNQLAEAGIPVSKVYEALGKKFGKTTEEIIKMKEAGKITATDAIEAIGAAMLATTGKKNFGEAAAEAGSTLQGMWDRAKAGFTNFMLDIGKAITPMLQRIAVLLGGTFEKLVASGRIEKFKAAFLRAFETFTAWIEGNWPKIEAAIFGFIDGVIAGLNFATDTLIFFQKHWETIKTIGIGLAVVFGLISLPFLLMSAAGLVVIGVIGGVVAALLWVVGVVAEFIPKAWQWGVSLIDGFVGGIRAGIGRVLAAAQSVANTVRNTLQSAFKFGSPSKTMEQFGRWTSQGFASGIERDIPMVAGATRELSSSTMGGAQAAGAVGGGGQNITYAPVINVNGANKTNEQVSVDIGAQQERFFQRFLEALAVEAGA